MSEADLAFVVGFCKANEFKTSNLKRHSFVSTQALIRAVRKRVKVK